MFKFISFGSGSSGNCYYLSNGTDALIIDAGIGIRTMKKYLMEYGINVTNIRGILVTHEHMDHTCAVGILSKFLNTKVYAAPLVLEKLMNSYRTRVDKSFCEPLDANTKIKLGNFTVEPFCIPHDSIDNLGYSFYLDNETFTIMTDIGEVTDEVRRRVGMSDYLVVEADYDNDMLMANPRYDWLLKQRIKGGKGHLSNEQTARLLSVHYHKRLKHVWLCHLSGENNTPETARSAVESSLRNQGIELGHDMVLDVLQRKKPYGPWYSETKQPSFNQLSINF